MYIFQALNHRVKNFKNKYISKNSHNTSSIIDFEWKILVYQ